MSVSYQHPLIGAKTRRKMCEITAAHAAKEIGMDPNSYSRAERGERRIYLDRALKLAKLLDCTVEQLGIEPSIDEQTAAYRKRLELSNLSPEDIALRQIAETSWPADDGTVVLNVHATQPQNDHGDDE